MITCHIPDVSPTPSPLLQSDSSKIRAGSCGEGLTPVSFTLWISFASQVSTTHRAGPGCDVGISSLLTAFGGWQEWEGWERERLLLSENKWVNVCKTTCKSHVFVGAASQTGCGHVLVKGEHLFAIPSQRTERGESENLNQPNFLCLNSCFLMLRFPSDFHIGAFSLYLSKPKLLHPCSHPKFSFSLFAYVCCYQQVRHWNENLAGHCVDEKWKRSKHSLLVCSYSGSEGLAVVDMLFVDKTCNVKL